MTPCLYAAANGHAETLEWFELDDLKATDQAGRTGLMWAAAFGHTQAMRLFIRHKDILEAKAVSDTNTLMFAVESGKREVVECLLEAVTPASRKKWIKEKDSNGNTPLAVAAQRGYLEVIKYFFSSCPGLEDKDLQCVLCQAAAHGHLSIVQFLHSPLFAP